MIKDTDSYYSDYVDKILVNHREIKTNKKQ